MKFFDCHVHTQFSPDSRQRMEDIVARALAMRGEAGGIAFTDHLDIDAPRNNGLFVFDVAEQQAAIEAQIEELVQKGSDLQLFKGIEAGLQPCAIEHTLQYTSLHKFDVVVASVHFIDGEDPYIGDYFNGKDYRQAFSRALELIHSTAVAYKDFDILGHFDYVVRYSPYNVKDLRYSDFADYIDAILKYLAENGKALEVNTKTYKEHRGHLQLLDENILKRFKELGGEMVTLGSDAHDTTRLCDNFLYFSQVIKRCGFDYLTYFKQRKAVLYNPEKD